MTFADWFEVGCLAPFALYFFHNLLPRRRNAAGWAILLLSFTCTAALGLSVYRQLVDDPLPPWVRTVLFVLIFAAGWTLYITFVVVSWRRRRTRTRT